MVKEQSVDWVRTWEGKCFGYLDSDNLLAHLGKHVSRRRGDDRFGPDGSYLEEIKSNNRLIVNPSKSFPRGSSFSPYGDMAAYAQRVDYIGYVMLADYKDFSPPEYF